MKAVIFDFDGTLTHKTINTWKQIWIKLGYDTVNKNGIYHTQMRDYLNNLTTYQEWCNQTCFYFKKGKLKKSDFCEIANNVRFIDGLEEFLKCLKNNGLSLHIVSGNFKEVIVNSLGEKTKYFDSINANIVKFDNNEVISEIIGTNYDYEGKAKFIKEYCLNNNIEPNEICFVGNGDNDQWAYLSGCKTICINPDTASVDDKTKWHKRINKVNNLNILIPYILN